ncbi:MAG: NAD-dependent epimerase/dehydratase family protein [Planctomycetota bacterium]
MSLKAMVTGGGGFLGGRIAQMLLDRGDAVRVLGRRHYPWLESGGAECVRGDVADSDVVRRACCGCDIVYHVAALTGIWGKPDDFWRTNVEGTRNVVEACFAGRVPKLVYTSSPSVVFGQEELCGVNESQPYPMEYLAAYPRSKAAAERIVLAAHGAALSTVALRPHLIWGPGDPHLIPRVIALAKAGQLRQVGNGKNLVDITFIDNAAEAHVLAGDAVGPEAACGGKAYFISQGEPVSLWPWLNGILRVVGVKPVHHTLSFRPAFALGACLEAVYLLLGVRHEPRMTRFLACQLAKSHYFDIQAARTDLGYRPSISTSEGVDRLTQWLRESSEPSCRLAVPA